jgi:hypothetical protein
MAEITIDIGVRRVMHAGQHYDAAMSGDEAGAGVVRRHGCALATRYLNLMHERCE